MESLLKYLPMLALVVGVWGVGNGILHDIFVVAQHKTGYDRDLLRLLLDGHVLITCGIMHIISWQLIKSGNQWGIWLCLAACISMLTYVGLIWPFLKSMVTLILNLSLLVLVILAFFQPKG